MTTKRVIVTPYNDNWKLEFEKIKSELLCVIEKDVLGIEHVGSTSVEGLSAKPIIDIDIIIESYDKFEIVVNKLKTIGYNHEGDLGIKDREAFKYNDKPHLMKHHLYVCPQNSAELKRHIFFRDYLRTHKEEKEEYSRIKQQAAIQYPNDIDNYIVAKSPYIERIFQKYGL